MDRRCATCQHYQPPDEFDTSIGRIYGTCTMAGSSYDLAQHLDSLAVAYDHEGYKASLRVSPEFGCVQWQETPDAAPRP